MNETRAGKFQVVSAAIEFVKVYGERNSGTTFVRDLIKLNFAVKMLQGSVSREERAKRIALVENIDDWLLGMIVKDRFETSVHPRLVREGFGWKHTNPPAEYLRSVPERTAKTLFFAVVKHPVFWALSFQKRPYHSYFRDLRMDFHDFVRHVFVPTGRDGVDAAYYDSVVELYAAKVDGYRRLADMGAAFELVRYEDLLLDIPGFLKRVEAKHGLARRKDEDIVREQSTKKGADATLADYQAQYRLDKVNEAVAPEDFDYIVEKFGKHRLAWLGYVS